MNQHLLYLKIVWQCLRYSYFGAYNQVQSQMFEASCLRGINIFLVHFCGCIGGNRMKFYSIQSIRSIAPRGNCRPNMFNWREVKVFFVVEKAGKNSVLLASVYFYTISCQYHTNTTQKLVASTQLPPPCIHRVYSLIYDEVHSLTMC